jgi:hypothetical protein
MAKFSFVLVLIAGCIAAISIIQLRHENNELRHQAQQLVGVSVDNQRLSNSIAQLRLAQADARGQFQELIRVRAEVKRLQSAQSNSVAQVRSEEQQRELARLQAEVLRLSQQSDQLDELREEIRQMQEAALARQPEQAVADAQPNESQQDQAMAMRMIRTQGETFADKLKRSVGAGDDEPFQAVFGRFLQVNGIQTNSIAASAYDSRTGRVIVRAPQSTLDQIERLTSALDRSP